MNDPNQVVDTENPAATPEKAQDTLQQIEALTKDTHRNLYRISTVFPFKIFPTEIVVSENSIDLIYHYFFFSQQTFPMLTKDIRNVKSSHSLFFSAVEFEVTGFEKNPPRIRWLPHDAAITIKRLVMGLLICQQKKIDLSVVDTSQIVDKIIEIGSAQTEDSPTPAK